MVRSWCEDHDWHADYERGVGTDALTLITPLHDYDEQDSFQLSYLAGVDADEERRYVYRKGRAIAFGDRFVHSTEPGKGRSGQQHAYLCFTFGTAGAIEPREPPPYIARSHHAR